MSIKILTSEVSEQIAAGEVVENPASVVKELVENSLDAGSTSIEVRLTDNGLKEIRVIDNGFGIPQDEAELAFQRHATSKIALIEDLQQIKTLGFRGEALASIGAVSRVALTTCSPDEICGKRIIFEGSSLIATEETGAPTGTEIIVKDLFYNTPARKAFLKSGSREMKKVSALLTGLAFSYPEIAFQLWNENRIVFKTKGDGRITDIITEAYGKNVAENMIPLKHTSEGSFSVSGYISNPLLTRSTRLYQTVLINRRLVRSTLISHSLKRGYGGLLPPNRFPLSIIYLEVPPDTIDVNIHPAKAEVRFHREREISGLIYKAVTRSLERNSPSGNITISPQRKARVHDTEPSGLQEISIKDSSNIYSLKEASIVGENTVKELPVTDLPENNNEKLFPEESYQLIGQYLASYIIAQKAGELVLIDQHAAHERILYEQIRETYRYKEDSSVPLASPITIEIPFPWEGRISEAFSLMEDAGFKIELFGYNTYIIRAIPVYLTRYFNRELFMDLVESIMEYEEFPEDKKDIIIKMASCKGAVKANQKLSRQEMSTLISELENTNKPFYCPHGRPAVISFNKNDIEKGFKRKGGKS